MTIRDKFMTVLMDMDKISEVFDTVDFDIFFLGGAACILGEYTDRATRDFDFVDLNYSAKMGKVFSVMRDFDMLEYESTILSPDYKSRAVKIEGIQNYNAYILAPEDIIISKIIRLEAKDIEDINTLINRCDKELLKDIVAKVEIRTDLYETKKLAFLENWKQFKEMYHV